MSRHPIDHLKKVEAGASEGLGSGDVDLLLSESGRRPAVVSNVDVSSLQVKKVDDVSEKIPKEEIMAAQKLDDVIGPVYEFLANGVFPTKVQREQLNSDSRILLKQSQKLSLEKGLLLRSTKTAKQIVLPKKFHQIVFTELHEKLAHVGSEKVYELARERFYWPRMQSKIDFYVRNQCRCVIAKKPNRQDRDPLVPIESQAPFDMIAIDFLHLDRAKGGFEYVLVISDHFTRWVQLYATKRKSATAAADKIFNDYVLKHGFPSRIHHDQGREFDNQLFHHLEKLSGMKASRTTPYHPSGNGMVERMNRTIINMLKTLGEKEKSNWKAHLTSLAFAYNSTICKSTGFSPYYLMFGRNPLLPVDVMFGIGESKEPTNELTKVSYRRFVDEWKKSLSGAYEIVRRHARKASETNKRGYDKKIRGVGIEVGDRVLSRNREKGGTGKLRTHWEDRVYVVVGKDPNVPVFTIRPLTGKGKLVEKRVHRNNIISCNYLLEHGEEVRAGVERQEKQAVAEPEEKVPDARRKRANVIQQPLPAPCPVVAPSLSQESDSESDDDVVVVIQSETVDESDHTAVNDEIEEDVSVDARNEREEDTLSVSSNDGDGGEQRLLVELSDSESVAGGDEGSFSGGGVDDGFDLPVV